MPLAHIAGNILIGTVCLALGLLLGQRRKIGPYFGLGLASVVFLCHYAVNSRPDIFYQILSSPSLIFYTNFFPFAAMLAIPCLWALSKKRSQKIRLAVLCALLLALSMWDYRYFTIRTAESRETYIDQNGVCLQTSYDTCSAAAAVTLLNMYGVSTTEQHVADLALTRQGRGTRHLGLVRALTSLTYNMPQADIRFENLTMLELMAVKKPAIIRVGIPQSPTLPLHHDLIHKYQWDPGILHDVVFMGVDDNDANYVFIAEPEFGMERWPVEHLDALFQGFAVYLDRPFDAIPSPGWQNYKATS